MSDSFQDLLWLFKILSSENFLRPETVSALCESRLLPERGTGNHIPLLRVGTLEIPDHTVPLAKETTLRQ